MVTYLNFFDLDGRLFRFSLSICEILRVKRRWDGGGSGGMAGTGMNDGTPMEGDSRAI